MGLKRNIFFALGPVGAAVASFITLPVLTWLFSPEDIGRAVMFQVTLSLSFAFFSLALEQAYVREFYEYPDPARLLKITASPGLLFLLITIIALYFSGLDLSYLVFGVENKLYSLLICLSVFFNFIIMYSSYTLRMREQAVSYSLITLCSKFAFLVLVMCSYGFGLENTFDQLLKMHVVALAMAMAAALIASRKDWLSAIRAPFDMVALPVLLKFSMPLIMAGLAYWGLTTLDRLSISWWSDFRQLGVYSVAMSFAGVAVLFQMIFTTIWTPIVYQWNVKGIDELELNKIINNVLAVVVILYVCVGMLSWIIGYILPPEYAAVKLILPACLSAPLLYMLSETTVVGIHIQRKTMLATLAPTGAVLTTLLLNYYLVPLYGAGGAAASTSIAFMVFLTLRTELSIAVWRKIPRCSLYAFTSVCAVWSALQALAVIPYIYGTVGWFIIFCFALVFFRNSIVEGADFLRFRIFAPLMNR